MLAALIGVQHGLDVHVLDQVTEGAKPQLVADLGATYHAGAIDALGLEPDVVIECTGVGSVIIDSIRHVAAGGVVCLTGVGSGGAPSGLSPADVAKDVVLQNNVVLWLGQRQQAALLPGRRGAGPGRPGLAGPADLPPGPAPEHRRRPAARARRHQGRRRLRRLTWPSHPLSGGIFAACIALTCGVAVVVWVLGRRLHVADPAPAARDRRIPGGPDAGLIAGPTAAPIRRGLPVDGTELWFTVNRRSAATAHLHEGKEPGLCWPPLLP